jgi:threonine synthase
MRWISTRGASPPSSFIDALFSGAAPDGGLYLPERLDPIGPERVRALAGSTAAEIGAVVGLQLLQGDITQQDLWGIVNDALNYPIPLVQVTDRVWALELFHGPTFAFKDVGARVQARLLHHFTDGTPLTILVATSGDTGSAVAQAFHGVPDTRVIVLYPQGQVTDVQEAQMASLGDNILAVAVDGTFDDCQRLVKTAFADDELRKHVWLTPANSINVGRLLPQVFYHFIPGRVDRPVVSVPSGNFGNLTAGLIAKRLGVPASRYVAATNVNDVVPEYLQTGHYQPRASVRTVANAMDVGAPNNFERMQALYGGDVEAIRHDVMGVAFDDTRVVAEIGEVYRKHGYLLDPHGAIAWLGLQEALAQDPEATGVFLATAHPAKFREVVEPAIGAPVALPSTLEEALGRPRTRMSLASRYEDLERLLRADLERLLRAF